jgi:hypothetical protein
MLHILTLPQCGIIDNGIEDLFFRTEIMIEIADAHVTGLGQFTHAAVRIAFFSKNPGTAEDNMAPTFFDERFVVAMCAEFEFNRQWSPSVYVLNKRLIIE